MLRRGITIQRLTEKRRKRNQNRRQGRLPWRQRKKSDGRDCLPKGDGGRRTLWSSVSGSTRRPWSSPNPGTSPRIIGWRAPEHVCPLLARRLYERPARNKPKPKMCALGETIKDVHPDNRERTQKNRWPAYLPPVGRWSLGGGLRSRTSPQMKDRQNWQSDK